MGLFFGRANSWAGRFLYVSCRLCVISRTMAWPSLEDVIRDYMVWTTQMALHFSAFATRKSQTYSVPWALFIALVFRFQSVHAPVCHDSSTAGHALTLET